MWAICRGGRKFPKGPTIVTSTRWPPSAERSRFLSGRKRSAVPCAGRRYRALNPLGARDGALLEIVNRGELALNGFRNRDLRTRLYPRKANPQTERRRASAVTRQLVLLRAHGLIAKVSHTHRAGGLRNLRK